MKKILAYLLTIAITATAAIGGTVAYLQDEDSDVNVMTLGKVEIKQHEYERVVNADGTFAIDTFDDQTSYVLREFKQGKPILPSAINTTTWEGWDWDSTGVRMTQVASYGSMQVFKAASNAQDKFVTVENTGKTDAYVRTLVAIEVGSASPALIGKSSHLTWEANEIGTIAIDGNNYYVIEFVYAGGQLSDGSWRHKNGILPAGDTSYPNLSQVYLKSEATNEDCEALDGNDSGTLDILVLSQAVQAAGFDDAQTALDTAFGDITTENHPWINVTIASEISITEAGTYDLKDDVYTIDSAYFHTQKVTDDVTINGNGATVEGIATSVDAFQWEGGTIPAMSPIFSSADGSKVTVNDLKFTGTMSAIMLGHYQNATYNKYDTELNKVDVIGTEVVSFSQNISPAVCVYGTATLNDCNVYGTTLSELDTDPAWPVYDVAAVNYSNLTVNNSKIGSIYMWNQAGVTIAEDSEVDTIIVKGNMNIDKYGLTVKAGATVGTIDLSAITNKAKVNITIEDGANFGGFVANGVTYATVADWQAAN